MPVHENRALAMVTGLILIACYFAPLNLERVSAADIDQKAKNTSESSARTFFLIVGKGKVVDPKEQQERGVAAVRNVALAARVAQPGAMVDALAENVMTVEQYRRGQVEEKVTGAIFKARLRRLAEIATPKDTVIIYTHSHGRRNGFEESQPLGGIAMDLPVRQLDHAGTILWDEYADLILKIPAKNVVVLTMSCFSGGLVEYLNSPPVLNRWRDRRPKEGRNLIVLTSQNKDLPSGPILKNKEWVNPFTLAVAKALNGEADGFALSAGKPVPGKRKDGKVNVGEMIDYITYTTENTISDNARRSNTAKPQVTGSFDRSDVFFVHSKFPTFPNSD